ncbi:hypothetical protein RUM44_003559 [Polyplax serrata]|uniref:Uncharacterized protein n=1 Tax=Polyplax serrata TaxID=468196 RepID=A0ABR1AHD6_POLSC
MEKISRRGGGEGEKGKARTERVTPKQQNKTTKEMFSQYDESAHEANLHPLKKGKRREEDLEEIYNMFSVLRKCASFAAEPSGKDTCTYNLHSWISGSRPSGRRRKIVESSKDATKGMLGGLWNEPGNDTNESGVTFLDVTGVEQ